MQVGWAKIAILGQHLSSSRVVNGSTAPSVIHIASPDCGKLMRAGKRRRLLFTGDDDEVFITRSLNVMRRQQNSI